MSEVAATLGEKNEAPAPSSAPVSAPSETKADAKPALRQPFPHIEPYDTGRLKVSDVHELYYEQVGNPEGKPIIYLHGGPGAGSSPFYRRMVDPKVYRLIQFDQRGSGKSTPHACCKDNTTWDLVEDINTLRKHLKIDQWVVYGGSWGSTLALAYAETHPETVKALVLRGIFMLRQKELNWFYEEGASFIFPDAWEDYLKPIPPSERHHLQAAYHRRLHGEDKKAQIEAAKAWTIWEMACSRLYQDQAAIQHAKDDDSFSLAFARIESHYFVNGGFFREDDQLLKDAHKLKDIPGTIIHGRYDLVCPMINAWDLHKAWPKSDLKIVVDQGHSAQEPGIIHESMIAVEKYANL